MSLRFEIFTEKDEEQRSYFTDAEHREIPKSEFPNPPKGTNDIHFEGRRDPKTGKPYIVKIWFTKDGKRNTEDIFPPKGSRPQDVHVWIPLSAPQKKRK